MSERIQVGRGAANGVASDLRHVGVLVGGVGNRRRGETPASVEFLHHIPLLVARKARRACERRLEVCSRVVAHSRGARESSIIFLLWNEWWRKAYGLVLDGCWRGYAFGVRLLGQLVQKTIPSPQETPILEHLRTCRVQLPEVSFSRRSILTRYLDEAVIQAKVMPNGVLPRGPPLPVVGKLLNDVIADFPQGQHLVR